MSDGAAVADHWNGQGANTGANRRMRAPTAHNDSDRRATKRFTTTDDDYDRHHQKFGGDLATNLMEASDDATTMDTTDAAIDLARNPSGTSAISDGVAVKDSRRDQGRKEMAFDVARNSSGTSTISDGAAVADSQRDRGKKDMAEETMLNEESTTADRGPTLPPRTSSTSNGTAVADRGEFVRKGVGEGQPRYLPPVG